MSSRGASSEIHRSTPNALDDKPQSQQIDPENVLIRATTSSVSQHVSSATRAGAVGPEPSPRRSRRYPSSRSAHRRRGSPYRSVRGQLSKENEDEDASPEEDEDVYEDDEDETSVASDDFTSASELPDSEYLSLERRISSNYMSRDQPFEASSIASSRSLASGLQQSQQQQQAQQVQPARPSRPAQATRSPQPPPGVPLTPPQRIVPSPHVAAGGTGVVPQIVSSIPQALLPPSSPPSTLKPLHSSSASSTEGSMESALVSSEPHESKQRQPVPPFASPVPEKATEDAEEDEETVLFSPKGTTLLKPLPLPLPVSLVGDSDELTPNGSTKRKTHRKLRRSRTGKPQPSPEPDIGMEDGAGLGERRKKTSTRRATKLIRKDAGSASSSSIFEDIQRRQIREQTESTKVRALSLNEARPAIDVGDQPPRRASISSILAEASASSSGGTGAALGETARLPESTPTRAIEYPVQADHFNRIPTTPQAPTADADQSYHPLVLSPSEAESYLARFPEFADREAIEALRHIPDEEERKRVAKLEEVAAAVAPTLADRVALLYFLQHPDEAQPHPETSPQPSRTSSTFDRLGRLKPQRESSSDITSRDWPSQAASPSYLSRTTTPLQDQHNIGSFAAGAEKSRDTETQTRPPALTVVITAPEEPSALPVSRYQAPPSTSRHAGVYAEHERPALAATGVARARKIGIPASSSLDQLPHVSFAPSVPSPAAGGPSEASSTRPPSSYPGSPEMTSVANVPRSPSQQPIKSARPRAIADLTVIPPPDEDSKPISRPVSVHQTPVSSSPSIASSASVPQLTLPHRTAGAPIFDAIPDTSDAESEKLPYPHRTFGQDTRLEPEETEEELHPLDDPDFDIRPPSPLAPDIEYILYKELVKDYFAHKKKREQRHHGRPTVEFADATSYAPDSVYESSSRQRSREHSPMLEGESAGAGPEKLPLARAGSYQSHASTEKRQDIRSSSGEAPAGATTSTITATTTNGASGGTSGNSTTTTSNGMTVVRPLPSTRTSATAPAAIDPTRQAPRPRYHRTLSPSSLKRLQASIAHLRDHDTMEAGPKPASHGRLPELFTSPHGDQEISDAKTYISPNALHASSRHAIERGVETSSIGKSGSRTRGDDDRSASDSEPGSPTDFSRRSFSGLSASSVASSAAPSVVRSATDAEQTGRFHLHRSEAHHALGPLEARDLAARQVGDAPHPPTKAEVEEGLRRIRRNSSSRALAAVLHPRPSQTAAQDHGKEKEKRKPSSFDIHPPTPLPTPTSHNVPKPFMLPKPQSRGRLRQRFDNIPEDDETASMSPRSRRESVQSPSRREPSISRHRPEAESASASADELARRRQMQARRPVTLGGRALSNSPTVGAEYEVLAVEQFSLDQAGTRPARLIVPASLKHEEKAPVDSAVRAPAPTPAGHSSAEKSFTYQPEQAPSGGLKYSRSSPNLLSSPKDERQHVREEGSVPPAPRPHRPEPQRPSELPTTPHHPTHSGSASARTHHDPAIFTFDPTTAAPLSGSSSSVVPHKLMASREAGPKVTTHESGAKTVRGPTSASASFSFGQSPSSPTTQLKRSASHADDRRSSPVPVAGVALGDVSSATARQLRSADTNATWRRTQPSTDRNVADAGLQRAEQFAAQELSHVKPSHAQGTSGKPTRSGSNENLRLQRRPSSLAQGDVLISEFSFLPQDPAPTATISQRKPDGPKRSGRVAPVLAPDAAETAAAAAMTALEVKRSRELLQEQKQHAKELYSTHGSLAAGPSITGDTLDSFDPFTSSSAQLSSTPTLGALPSLNLPQLDLGMAEPPPIPESRPPPFTRSRSYTVSDENPPYVPGTSVAGNLPFPTPSSPSVGAMQPLRLEDTFSLSPELSDDLVRAPEPDLGAQLPEQLSSASIELAPEGVGPLRLQYAGDSEALQRQQHQHQRTQKSLRLKQQPLQRYSPQLRPGTPPATEAEGIPPVWSWRFWFGLPPAKSPQQPVSQSDDTEMPTAGAEGASGRDVSTIRSPKPVPIAPVRKSLTQDQFDSLPPIDARLFLGAVNMQIDPKLNPLTQYAAVKSTTASGESAEPAPDSAPLVSQSSDAHDIDMPPDPDNLFPILVPKDVSDSTHPSSASSQIPGLVSESLADEEAQVRAETLAVLEELLPSVTRRGMAKAVRRASSSSLALLPPHVDPAYLPSYFASPSASSIFASSAEPVVIPEMKTSRSIIATPNSEWLKRDRALRESEAEERRIAAQYGLAQETLLGTGPSELGSRAVAEHARQLRGRASRIGLVNLRPEPKPVEPTPTEGPVVEKQHLPELSRRGKPLSHRVPTGAIGATEESPAEEATLPIKKGEVATRAVPGPVPISSAVSTHHLERELQQEQQKRIQEAGAMAVDKRLSELSSVQFIEDAAEKARDEILREAEQEAELLERGPAIQDEPGPYISRAPADFYPPPVAALPRHVSSLLHRAGGDYANLSQVLDVDNPSHIDSIVFHELDEGLDSLQPAQPESADLTKAEKSHATGPLVQFLCGSVAGCVAETLTLPLDVSKVRRQLDTNALVAARLQASEGAQGAALPDASKVPAQATGASVTTVSAPASTPPSAQSRPGGQEQKAPQPTQQQQKRVSVKEAMDKIAKLERKLPESARAPPTQVPPGATLTPRLQGRVVQAWMTNFNSKSIIDRVRQSSYTVATIQDIIKTEGIRGLYKGLPPALLRQFLKAGLQMSLFKEFKQLICTDTSRPTMTEQFASSVSAAVVGQFIANPADVLKVRLMADGRRILRGEQPRYKGIVNAAFRITKEEGWKGFYKGAVPAMQRSALSSGGGLAIYAHLKTVLTDPQGYFRMEQGPTTYLLTSSLSSLLSTFMAAPADTVKTRMMNQAQDDVVYKGFWDCLKQTVRREGFASLFKGMGPNFIRVVPWQMIFYFTYENLTSYVTGSGL